MNLLLLRSGYPPAIIHSTERQRYYEALKGSSATMHSIVQDAIENSLASHREAPRPLRAQAELTVAPATATLRTARGG
jgi:hypothetical protein